MPPRYLLLLATLVLYACTLSNPAADTERQVKSVIMRYNQLLADGYRSMNMNPLQEVATVEQATRLYHHMAALGEGKLRMDSALKGITFVKTEYPRPGEAVIQTRENWDFTHINIDTGKKFAEERGFIYEMRYQMKRDGSRWAITNVDTLSGTSTDTVIPWPEKKRPPPEPLYG
ncbi:hypothetical protein OR1_00085 [Geobacter sp. OR-1]|uniref:hypothetical protein n=1 Tax=Geobacter sp. OR-1 TaxID=1266765 RepID=UPI000544513C|nr:hypothetical protein [Geobacter sp. OR-1]GAM07816.1 hypothetical protein OR1_00085 [Geobacter sp. OR-1]